MPEQDIILDSLVADPAGLLDVAEGAAHSDGLFDGGETWAKDSLSQLVEAVFITLLVKPAERLYLSIRHIDHVSDHGAEQRAFP